MSIFAIIICAKRAKLTRDWENVYRESGGIKDGEESTTMKFERCNEEDGGGGSG